MSRINTNIPNAPRVSEIVSNLEAVKGETYVLRVAVVFTVMGLVLKEFKLTHLNYKLQGLSAHDDAQIKSQLRAHANDSLQKILYTLRHSWGIEHEEMEEIVSSADNLIEAADKDVEEA